eukprot:596664-Hanusia_phi.AAC.3
MEMMTHRKNKEMAGAMARYSEDAEQHGEETGRAICNEVAEVLLENRPCHAAASEAGDAVDPERNGVVPDVITDGEDEKQDCESNDAGRELDRRHAHCPSEEEGCDRGEKPDACTVVAGQMLVRKVSSVEGDEQAHACELQELSPVIFDGEKETLVSLQRSDAEGQEQLGVEAQQQQQHSRERARECKQSLRSSKVLGRTV